jgi:hypothetical protein
MIERPRMVQDGRYLIYLIDNSPSARSTVVGDDTLFGLQVREFNRFLDAIKQGANHARTWVLVVTFQGALEPGWQRLEDVEKLKPEEIPTSACSPVIDLVAGLFDLAEVLVANARSRIFCAIFLATDGLDGVCINGKDYPVSITTADEVKLRAERFYDSNFLANAVATGADGGEMVTKFLRSLGFREQNIFPVGLNASDLRRVVMDATDQTMALLN